MTPVSTFAGRAVALFGLGGSGLATAKALEAGGADVLAFDDSEAGRQRGREAGLSIVDLKHAEWSRFAALILSPGVPLTHPAPHWTVPLARAAGVEIIGDIELFCRERAARAPGAPFIAVTGTNGKSTTTALIAHLLRNAGRKIGLGGNIGTPILALPPPQGGRVHVIEMSSFQIDLTPSLAPSIGILLNLSPDHLDRHGTMENYIAVKERLIAGSDVAIVGVDDDFSESIALRHERSGRPTVHVSLKQTLAAGIHVRGREIFAWRGHGRKLADLAGINALRGDHNAQNAAAAVAAVIQLGLKENEIQAGLATFPGLPHRLEEVGRVGKALLVNDSKATNADSTEKALSSFEDGIFWIAGGRPKEGGITALERYFGRVAKAYLIGEAAADFARTLTGKAEVEVSGTLEAAIAAAARDARESAFAEPVILLSPSCASYDQFANFEARGARFRALAGDLEGFEPRR